MLDHLVGVAPAVEALDKIKACFMPAELAPSQKLFNAQVITSQWLNELGAPDDDEITAEQQQEAAREAFVSLTTDSDPDFQQESLLRLKSPAAVEKLNAMLTTYEWEFVERAKEIRAYAVGKILEETSHHDARVRLRALELLGKVTEIGLFTDRVEIKNTNVSNTELESRIKEKLERLLIVNGQLEDVKDKHETPDDTPGSA